MGVSPTVDFGALLRPAIAPGDPIAAALIADSDTEAAANLFETSSRALSFWEEVREAVRRTGDPGRCDRRRNAGSLWPLDADVAPDAALPWSCTGEPGVAEAGAVSFP